MPWQDDPSPALRATFEDIARTRMAGLPIVNPRLEVEPVGFARGADGHWTGIMLTPWAINLLRLPGAAADWPAVPAGGRCDWQFSSGNYEFTVAEEERLGVYHLCSLFSPVQEFESHEAARLTAEAALAALDPPPAAPSPEAPAQPSRRAFFGLRGDAR